MIKATGSIRGQLDPQVMRIERTHDILIDLGESSRDDDGDPSFLISSICKTSAVLQGLLRVQFANWGCMTFAYLRL